MRYVDASALVKRYVREAGSAKVNRLLRESLAATSRLTSVEVASALIRRARAGDLSQDDCDRALRALASDMSFLLVVELTPDVAQRAEGLLRTHSLRAGDATQLASALFLQDELAESVTLMAFDDRLVTAARLEGLALA